MATYTLFVFGIYYYFDDICNNPIYSYMGCIVGIIIGTMCYFKFVNKIQIHILSAIASIGSGVFLLLGYIIKSADFSGAVACIGARINYVNYSICYSLMLGDVLDDEEARTGIVRAGIYNSVDSVIASLSNGAQSIFLIIVLAFGYVESLAPKMQSETAKSGIMIAWLLLPAILMIIGAIWIIFLYPINKKRKEENLKVISKIRGELHENR